MQKARIQIWLEGSQQGLLLTTLLCFMLILCDFCLILVRLLVEDDGKAESFIRKAV